MKRVILIIAAVGLNSAILHAASPAAPPAPPGFAKCQGCHATVADPAAAVPGTRMPKVAMTPAERGAFVDYLTELK